MVPAPNSTTPAPAGRLAGAEPPHASAVAWGAIFAGAAAALAAGIVLVTLGAGIGLTTVSPWSDTGASVKAVGVAAVIWLVVVQWLSAALGGFLTGRLRVRWSYFHRDEVYFRDTAHGFLAWSVAVVLGALVATSMTAGLIGGAAKGVAAGAKAESSMGYFSDSLYRSDMPTTTDSAADIRGETTRILANAVADDGATDDRAYLARLVAARTGLSAADAQQRVDAVIQKAKAAADTARKVAAQLAIATALSLAIGAFIAAVAAGIGGHERDE